MDDSPFLDTLLVFPHRPDWRPLARVARLSRSTDAYPSIDEHDFMYMGCVESRGGTLRIHLYKHIDTRHYLNLDDAGHAYRHRGHIDEVDDRHAKGASGGRYVLHGSLGDALHHVVDDLEWMRA